MPKVSVVIPTFNRTEFLRRAILSVLEQTYKDFEIIVVQNGDREYSKTLCQEFAKEGVRIRYFYDPKPDSVNARNVGVLEANGEYIAFLDDDDEWLPLKLEHQLLIMDQFPEIGLVTCDRDMRGEGAQILLEKIKHKRNEEPLSFNTLVRNGCQICSFSAVLIRRKCFDEIGLFNSRYRIGNDYDFYLRLARKYPLYSLKQPLIQYHLHPDNMSRDLTTMFSELVEILQRLQPEPAQGVTSGVIRQSTARYFYVLAAEAVDQKNYGLACRNFFSALSHNPFVGLRISWSRFENSVYKFLRPYLAVAYCGFLSSVGGLCRKN